jgi:hypothetical protein
MSTTVELSKELLAALYHIRFQLGVRFLLTVQVAAYLDGHAQLPADDPILAKLHARFTATPALVGLAGDALR